MSRPGIPARVASILVAALFASGGCAGRSEPADLAIWRIVDSGCNGPAAGTDGVSGAGALQCNIAQGYAVLKDRCGPTHYLVIPTRRRVGVESPELMRADEPNYFALAWARRTLSMAAAPDPADADVGLAINSRYGRSQAQLHIHIDRLAPEVRAALGALAQPVAPGTRVPLMGHTYRIDPVASLTPSPFVQAAAAWGAQTEDERARLTVALVGDGRQGYYLLSDRADLMSLDRGHAEELLVAHSCMR
jgi:CDP-diacylglycerol pyrophosphatase